METFMIIMVILVLALIVLIILMLVKNQKDRRELFKKLPDDYPDPKVIKSEFDLKD